jgi:hypothetical protein
MEYKKYQGGETMLEIVGKLRCPVCREAVHLNDQVFLDITNGIIHQKCHHNSPTKFPIKDKGSFKRIIIRYPFFHKN